MRKHIITRKPTLRERVALLIQRMLKKFHAHEVMHQNASAAAFLLIVVGISNPFLVMKSIGGVMALVMEAMLLGILILRGILFLLEVCEEPLF